MGQSCLEQCVSLGHTMPCCMDAQPVVHVHRCQVASDWGSQHHQCEQGVHRSGMVRNRGQTFRPNARNDGTGYKGNHCAMGRLYLQIYNLYGAEDRRLLVHLHNVPRKAKLHSPMALERHCWTILRGRDE